MKKELPPAVVYLIIAIVVVVVVGIGYKMLGPKGFKADTAGSEKAQQQLQQTGTFYQPTGGGPPNIQVPGRTAPPGGGR